MFFAGETDELLDETQRFLTGNLPAHATDRVLATVLFTDIVDSTRQAATVGDREWRNRLDAHNELVRKQLRRFHGQEINTTGDGFVATFDGPARAIRCACTVRDEVHGLGMDLRIGVHTGEVERHDDDISGLTVHIGARVAALAGAGDVLVSKTVTDLVVGSGIAFRDRGQHELKGVPGSWQLFAVGA
jgi:class 3 adenylate cyclase